MVKWLLDNKEWVFSGVGVAVIATMLSWILLRKRQTPHATLSQKQSSDQRSISVQAGGNALVSIQSPIPEAQARAILLKLFEENFYRLSGVAANVARSRAEELVEGLLQRLSAKQPNVPGSIADPDVQYAMYEAQKAFARSGDSTLLDLLLELLVSRVTTDKRDLRSLILNEALGVCSRLTLPQLNTLATLFLVKHHKSEKVTDAESFRRFIVEELLPFARVLPESRISYLHLAFCGCAVVPYGSPRFRMHILEKCFAKNYEKAMELFAQERGLTTIGGHGLVRVLLATCDASLVQFLRYWDGFWMDNMSLTSVGMVLASAHIYQLTKRAEYSVARVIIVE